MGFKQYIKESDNSDIVNWKKAWNEFYSSANKLSKAWEAMDIRDTKFLKAYADVFKQSFDEVADEIHDLNELAKKVVE